MATITISRQFGSGGDEIADQLCQILGYRHFDKRMIARAAAEANLSEREIAGYSDYSEETYKVKSFLDHLLRRTPAGKTEAYRKEDSVGVLLAEEKRFNEASALKLVQEAIGAAYRADNMIIIGRGGQLILKDRSNVLHIRIEAPLQDRIHRVQKRIKAEEPAYSTSYGFRFRAEDSIIERDAASSDYIRVFYGANWADTSLYHAILNTGKMSLEACAQIIADMVHQLFDRQSK